jgi:hypothetical protein
VRRIGHLLGFFWQSVVSRLATLLALAKLGNRDFNIADCRAQRFRFGADCAAGDRQKFIADFRSGPENLIILDRAVDQVQRSQVIHRWPHSTGLLFC